MIDGTKKTGYYTQNGKTVSFEGGRVRFAVEESFKGVSATEMTLPALEGMCGGRSFVRGERYLVYARYSDSSGLFIGVCSPTKKLEEAESDLQFLRSLPAPGTGGRLYGKVAVNVGGTKHSPLSGITVVVKGEMRQRIEMKTDSNGNFELNGLKPGKYIVNIVLPENYVLRISYDKDREVTIFDRGCTPCLFVVQADGRLIGRLTDSAQRPALANLTLVSIEQPKRTFWGYSYEDGQFEIEGISPGRYILYIELNVSDKEEPYFYPGVSDRSQATIIEIGMAEKLSGYDFQLPPKLQLRTVQGIIMYSDGRPACGVNIQLVFDEGNNEGVYTVEGMDSSAVTDALGHFTLYGYKGASYKIIAQDLRDSTEEHLNPGRIESRPLILKTDVTGIKIVIPLEKDSAENQPSRKTKSEP